MRPNKRIRETLDSLESQITEKSDSFYESLAEQLGKVESDIISSKYNLEVLQEQQDSLKNQSRGFMILLTGYRLPVQTCCKKNQASQETISRLKEEQKAKFPIWSNRPTEIQNAIQAEQDSIHFREQRFFKDSGRRGIFRFCRFPAGISDIKADGIGTGTDGKADFRLQAEIQIIPADMRNFADICLKTRFFQRDSGLRKTNPYTNMHKR